ncbi:hypothetical protein SELMODRAFT_409559 [Selaginella moellendorffii]|uniref:Uncharacterized protein n=1 Tax=Selaginella moellendorffii TaxID=88036 RepID=D8RBU7_SELML|nr:hypothetical protein SELMODRAFT_409559 [Selaginella moellendorffii]
MPSKANKASFKIFHTRSGCWLKPHSTVFSDVLDEYTPSLHNVEENDEDEVCSPLDITMKVELSETKLETNEEEENDTTPILKAQDMMDNMLSGCSSPIGAKRWCKRTSNIPAAQSLRDGVVYLKHL